MKLSPTRKPVIDLKKIEDLRQAKFIGCFPIGGMNQHVYCFYNKEKHPRGSHYFGVFFHPIHEGWFVIDAGEVEKKVYSGILRPDGTILHSYFRHDYAEDELGNMVDGGNEYFKHRVAVGMPINFNFKDGDLYEVKIISP